MWSIWHQSFDLRFYTGRCGNLIPIFKVSVFIMFHLCFKKNVHTPIWGFSLIFLFESSLSSQILSALLFNMRDIGDSLLLSGKESICNAGNLCSIPGLRRSPGVGNGNALQYFCLENSMDRGAWWVTAHRVTKSWTHTHGRDLLLLLLLFIYYYLLLWERFNISKYACGLTNLSSQFYIWFI